MPETSTPPSPPPRAASIGQPDARWRPGAIVGEYRLIRRLGAGGMGAVDLAEHVETGALRAIKSLPSSADSGLILRFRREAEAQARVDGHPHVARVHTAGVALGHHYLVMEHLPGGDLEQRLRQGPWPAADVVALGVALARGLAHVHAQGILHRDLKPANVLFDGPGPEARPVIVDFGLARLHSSSLTGTGELLGTPAYMAPEQALGAHEEVGPRTDVYGLGALLYRALCGRAPADGSTVMAVLTAVVHHAPRPPRELAPGVPPGLERALLRALAKRPEDRFASATAFAEALEAAHEGGDPGARPLRRVARAAAAALVVALAALALVRGFTGRTAEPAAPPPSIVPAPAAPIASAARPVSSPAPGPRRLARVEEILDPPETLPGDIRLRFKDFEFLPRYAIGQHLISEARNAPDDDPRYVLAARLLAKAAREGGERGPTDPWRDLGHLFLAGRGGLARSRSEAARCYRVGASRGDVECKRLLAGLLLGTPGAGTGELAEARALYREVVALGAEAEPENQRLARIGLGWLALRDHDRAALAEAHAALSDRAGSGGEARLVHGNVLLELGRIDDALAELREALPDRAWGGGAARKIIATLTAAGRQQEADAALADLATRAATGSTDHCLTYGDILAHRGDVVGARQAARLLEPLATDVVLWHGREARRLLYELCLRVPDLPVTLGHARELLLLEPDGAALMAQIDRELGPR